MINDLLCRPPLRFTSHAQKDSFKGVNPFELDCVLGAMACTFRGRLTTYALNTGWLAVPLSHPDRCCGWSNAFSLSESRRTNQTISDALCSEWLWSWTVTSCLS
jgi:hypothetical protein